MYYVNKNIKTLYRISSDNSRLEYMRLDMNENPEGLPQEFVTKTLSQITPEYLSTYPDKFPLTKLLSNHFHVSFDQIALFNGSDEAIRLIFECFASENGKTVAVEPTFAMYHVYAHMYKQNYIMVPYDEDFQINFDRFLSAIDEHTDLVFALNPNNPIGTVFTDTQMKLIVERARDCGAIVIIDEAYHYFYASSFISLMDNYNNIIILRTFSKLLSLASLRLGIAISTTEIISLLNKSSCSYNVNGVALKFGEEIFKSTDLIQQLIAKQLEGKKYLIETLLHYNYCVKAFEGNFIFVKPNSNKNVVVDTLKQNHILVKTYDKGILKPYIRISTGSIDIMRKFLHVFLDIDYKKR